MTHLQIYQQLYRILKPNFHHEAVFWYMETLAKTSNQFHIQSISAENVQLMDDAKVNNSIIKKAFIRIYQHGAQVDDENQRMFFFGECLNYMQVGKGYLDFEIKVIKADNTILTVADDNTNDVIRLVDNAFASTMQGTPISTSAGTEIEPN